MWAGLEGRCAALVSPGVARNGVEHARHASFIAAHLFASALTLMLAPLWLAFAGAPSITLILAFALLQMPMAAAVLLSKTGHYNRAIALAVATALALATTMAWGGQATLVWPFLLIAALESAQATRRKTIALGLLATGTTALALAVASFIPDLAVPASAPQSAAALGGALLLAYAGLLLWSSARVQALRQTKQQRVDRDQLALARTMGDIVLQQDRGGNVLSASDEALSLFKLSAQDIAGRGFFERVHVADRPAYLTAIADALGSDDTKSVLLRLRTQSTPSQHGDFDEPVFAPIEMRVRRIGEDAAAPVSGVPAVISIVRDATRLHACEQELAATREQAERAIVWKDRFLANMSHELRTPLNAIIGFSEILGSNELMPTDAARRLEYANIIHGSGQHLLAVVNSILDMSKIEAGSFDIMPEPFDLPPLLNQCCDIVRLKAANTNVTLLRDYDVALEELIADRRACKQIVINLLSNAVKFTPSGGLVRISARPQGNAIVLSVADTGIGIAPADLGRVGTPFFQASATHARQYEGTGLGLSVVRGLVGLHGGSMSVESEPGRGTTVTISLPLDCRGVARNGGPVRIETIARAGHRSPISFSEDVRTRKIA